MLPTSQIVRTNAIVDIHSLSEALEWALCQTVRMADQEKNGGPTKLQAWREHRGLTQEELADVVDTSGGMISMLETGERGLTVKWLRKLGPALETDPSNLIDVDPRAANDAAANMPSEDELAEMVAQAQQELEAGTSLADYPRAVVPSLLTRLRQFVSDHRAAPGHESGSAPDKAAPPPDSTTPDARE
jgi:transcriptional regulator with XRE-family HTH domain